MPLALATTAIVAMGTASTALSTTKHAINRLYGDSFHLSFYQRILDEARARHQARTESSNKAPTTR